MYAATWDLVELNYLPKTHRLTPHFLRKPTVSIQIYRKTLEPGGSTTNKPGVKSKDPDPGWVKPGSGSGSRIRDEQPESYFRELRNHFWGKNT